ncbi:murein hydrolase activator EnvC family protein [Natronoglycomyces albus]|uniref:M23 family metallopeptidase n=1 Tax=Natronoglycomyces albus TaxID=2811108 RepID=A0A895XM77_9ACTN|nr:M23 family metallopeptidase [Natronoglycomyces albus]QSB06217.1 M23 family metallopeptidase [Natronoglycomyces albus]
MKLTKRFGLLSALMGVLVAMGLFVWPPSPVTDPDPHHAMLAVSWPITHESPDLASHDRLATRDSATPLGQHAEDSPADGLSSGSKAWRAPLIALRVVRPFHPPPLPWAAGHRGVDLAGSHRHVITAARDGVVVYADRLNDRGVVAIAHPGGWRTSYEPVEASVRTGQHVRAGDEIGLLVGAHRGCDDSDPCLHWGARLHGRYVDPLWLLGLGQARLLPRPDLGMPEVEGQ